MILLDDYRKYWEALPARVPGIGEVMAVTVDDSMGARIKALPKDSVTLFWLPPAGDGSRSRPDAFRDDSECVVFVMERYDPQRRDAIDVLAGVQGVVEAMKECMAADAAGCCLFRFDTRSFSTLPETKFYAGFAGWSLGFRIEG